MPQSEKIDVFAAALAKAQAAMKVAPFNKVNPHFKNKYADLTAVIDAVRKPLNDNGIAFTQMTENQGGAICLVTRFLHSSGQWMSGEYPLPANVTPQQLGSALTYAKRYSLAAMAGISSDEDDDAEGARKDNQVTPMKRENPSVTRLEDLTDRRYRVDERGNRYDWIDTSEVRVEPLKTVAETKVLYKLLRDAMLLCETPAELVEWGENHVEQVKQLGKHEDIFQLREYQQHLDDLRSKQKAA